jgi:hypothetical protein
MSFMKEKGVNLAIFQAIPTAQPIHASSRERLQVYEQRTIVVD